MDWTTIKFSELMRQKSRRMDAKYWIKKKQKKNKSSSSQAGGPAPDKSGHKQLRLTADKLIRYYEIHK